jgi:hypothetical protein
MPPFSLRRLLWDGPLSILVAILANLFYYGMTKALGEQYLMPLGGGSSYLSPMLIQMPVIVTLIPGLVAMVLFGLLLRYARRPATIFLSVSLAALILSFGGPFNLPAATMQTKMLLSGMHIIAAVIVTIGILLLSHTDAKIP